MDLKDLKGLGDAISEALALRGKMATVEDSFADMTAQIERNKKEIDRLTSLQSSTENLEGERKVLKAELSDYQAELDKRLAKLDKAGVSLPINEPSGAKKVSL